MKDLRKSLEQMKLSTAYHEAGHVVAAVLQRLPLHGGVHIDLEGSGVSYYCHRWPGDSDLSDDSLVEREKTIIALYAGWVAQHKYLPDFDDCDAWKSDWAVATLLLKELGQIAPELTENVLYKRAEQLIFEHWPIVDGLASELWRKQVTSLPQGEFEKGWSRGTRRQEKFMSRSEIQAFFAGLGMSCSLWPI